MTRNKKLVRLMAATIAATTVATSMPALAAFDANYYAKQNPDVVAAVGTTPKALENHYNTFGKKEGRAASAEDLANSPLRQIFDAKLYAQLYPDVVAVFGTDADKLFQHFMTFGINEGRKINQYFDVNAYKAAYPDLAKAFGDNTAMYYQHFVTFGIKEHRTLGGFPAENILPGGTKKVAASGGSSGGSSGGGSASSGGSSSGAVTPGSGLPTNVAHNEKAVASANAQVTAALADVPAEGLSKTAKDELVASAQSTLKAAQDVNTRAQANLATATEEKTNADKALVRAEDAVANSKTEGVKKFVASQPNVAAVATAQGNYYEALEALEEAKANQEAKATALVNAQAAAKTAQADYNTALQNAKDTYVAVSGNPSSYIADKKYDDVVDALDDLAGSKTAEQNKTAVEAFAAKDKNNKDLAIIDEDGKVDSANYQEAIKKATNEAKETVLATYQKQYLNDILSANSSYGAADDAELTPEAKKKLEQYGVTVNAAWKKDAKGSLDDLDGVDPEKLATLTSSTIATAGTKVNEKTITVAENTAVKQATDEIDDAIDKYNAAVSKESLVDAEDALNNTTTGALKKLTTAEEDKKTADTAVVNAEKDVTTADKAVKTAEEARDEAYADEGVAGNAELAVRDAAQATAAKEAYELEKATAAATAAQNAEDAAYTNYDSATKVKEKAD